MPHYPPLTLQIAGESLGIEHRKSFTVRNPATGALIAQLPADDAASVAAKAAASPMADRLMASGVAVPAMAN